MMSNGTSGDINNINFFEGEPPAALRTDSSCGHRCRGIALTGPFNESTTTDWVPLEMRETEIELGVRDPTKENWLGQRQLIEASGPQAWTDHGDLRERNRGLGRVSGDRMGQTAGDPHRRPGDRQHPCETFVETGLAIKKQSPLKPTFTIELANGYNGYLPTPEQHALGGYETWRAKCSYLAVDAEPQIRETLIELLDQVASRHPRIAEGPLFKRVGRHRRTCYDPNSL